jgi:HD superfamily phosphohydrolase
MHREIYNHKTAKILELMISDIMILIDPILLLSESISDIQKFCLLTDNYILSSIDIYNKSDIFKNLSEDNKKRLTEATIIYNRIIKRELYSVITNIQYGNTYEMMDKITKFKKYYPKYNSDDFFIIDYKIGLVGGNKPDPFSKIFFYNKIEDIESFTMKRTEISLLITDHFQEKVCFLVCKNNKLYEDARNDWLSDEWIN